MYPLIQKTHRFIQKAYRGQMGAYIQVLAVLLLLAAGIYTVLLTTGCGIDLSGSDAFRQLVGSWASRRSTGQKPDSQVRLQANAQQARPGERATRVLGFQGDPSTTQVTYRWDPPPGATNPSYNPPPDHRGPPALWLDRSPTDEIRISYDQPPLPPGETAWMFVDTARVFWDGHESSASYRTLITNNPSPLAVLPLAATPARTDAMAATELWEISQWVEQQGITLTTDLCQDWFALLQNDDAFLAMRTPVSSTAALTESYPLPIVFGDEYSNTLQLFSYDPFGSVITVPVELRPERHTFLENELPSASGEHWMALGPVSDTVTCPGYELAADRWGFKWQNYLDMTHQPNNCEGCVLPIYYCYEGQEAPSALAAVSSMLGAGANATSYRGWNITCVGPQAVPLRHEPVWELGGATSVWVTPTMVITVHHYILLDFGSDPMTFTLDYTDTLGMEWNIYGGDWSEPDMGAPVTLPIVVTEEDPQHLWMISEPVPTDAAAGDHPLTITVTSVASPADSLWATDMIWVGDWVAPPTPPEYDFFVHLPLVLKSH